jgi:hypothetical protein
MWIDTLLHLQTLWCNLSDCYKDISMSPPPFLFGIKTT